MPPFIVDRPGEDIFSQANRNVKKGERIYGGGAILKRARWPGSRSCKKDTRSGDKRKSRKRKSSTPATLFVGYSAAN
jgi:hypothetical protein